VRVVEWWRIPMLVGLVMVGQVVVARLAAAAERAGRRMVVATVM
jgi:hypothetical protein